MLKVTENTVKATWQFRTSVFHQPQILQQEMVKKSLNIALIFALFFLLSAHTCTLLTKNGETKKHQNKNLRLVIGMFGSSFISMLVLRENVANVSAALRDILDKFV